MKKKKTGKIPQTALGRSMKILSGGASMLAKEVTGRIKAATSNLPEDGLLATRLKQAQQLVDTLGDLKGAAMKAGQLLSLEASDLMPPEVVQILRQLHDRAPPMPYGQVERILKKELGPERFARLSEISREPVAAASIGQVHSAMVDDRKIALKIQFPGVAKSIDSDLGLLKKVAQGFLALQGKDISLDALFKELAASLRAEVDYTRELASLQQYRDAFAGDERFYVPEPFPELSTKHVLALEFVDGVKMNEWLQKGASEAERTAFASRVVDLLVKEFYEAGLVQTDPNYGNFLYRPQTRQIVLLDFGATHTYSKQFRRDYRALLLAADKGDDDEILERSRTLFHIDTREKPETLAMFLELMHMTIRMFHPDHQPLRFDDLTYIEEIRDITVAFIKAVEFSPPPQQLLFLNRKLGGMFHLLKDAHAALDLSGHWERVQALDLEGAD